MRSDTAVGYALVDARFDFWPPHPQPAAPPPRRRPSRRWGAADLFELPLHRGYIFRVPRFSLTRFE